MEESIKEQIQKSLYKLAKGFEYKETVEEYSVNKENQLELSKKKISTHYIQPDMIAIKMLLELSGQSVSLSDMSDEELIALKNNLIKELSGGEK